MSVRGALENDTKLPIAVDNDGEIMVKIPGGCGTIRSAQAMFNPSNGTMAAGGGQSTVNVAPPTLQRYEQLKMQLYFRLTNNHATDTIHIPNVFKLIYTIKPKINASTLYSDANGIPYHAIQLAVGAWMRTLEKQDPLDIADRLFEIQPLRTYASYANLGITIPALESADVYIPLAPFIPFFSNFWRPLNGRYPNIDFDIRLMNTGDATAIGGETAICRNQTANTAILGSLSYINLSIVYEQVEHPMSKVGRGSAVAQAPFYFPLYKQARNPVFKVYDVYATKQLGVCPLDGTMTVPYTFKLSEFITKTRCEALAFILTNTVSAFNAATAGHNPGCSALNIQAARVGEVNSTVCFGTETITTPSTWTNRRTQLFTRTLINNAAGVNVATELSSNHFLANSFMCDTVFPISFLTYKNHPKVNAIAGPSIGNNTGRTYDSTEDLEIAVIGRDVGLSATANLMVIALTSRVLTSNTQESNMEFTTLPDDLLGSDALLA